MDYSKHSIKQTLTSELDLDQNHAQMLFVWNVIESVFKKYSNNMKEQTEIL